MLVLIDRRGIVRKASLAEATPGIESWLNEILRDLPWICVTFSITGHMKRGAWFT